jgi:hypothetical protein
MCQELREQQIIVHIKFEKEKQTLTAPILDWKNQYEIVKVHLSKPNSILPLMMNNRLQEFEKLLLYNTIQSEKSSLGR